MLMPSGTLGSFRWQIPELYNIGVEVCGRHADRRGCTAIIYADEAHHCQSYTFSDLKDLSNRFANVLVANGLKRGDHAGVLLPQMPATAIPHFAVFKAGAIAVPLFTLFDQEAIEFRLADSAANVLVADSVGLARILPIRERLPNLTKIYIVRQNVRSSALPPGLTAFETARESASPQFVVVSTGADDPAMLIYTSGTTGPRPALNSANGRRRHLQVIGRSTQRYLTATGKCGLNMKRNHVDTIKGEEPKIYGYPDSRTNR